MAELDVYKRQEQEKLRQIGGTRGEILAQQLQQALPAMALDGQTSLNTAFANDVNGTLAYAQQVYGYGRAGDVFLAITTCLLYTSRKRQRFSSDEHCLPEDGSAGWFGAAETGLRRLEQKMMSLSAAGWGRRCGSRKAL